MPFWLKMMFLIGSYIGMWILTAWAQERWFGEGDDECEAAILGMFWPVTWAFYLVVAPSMLIAWIVRKMNGEKR